MTIFDDREKQFENKFAHDEETAFRVIARRNKLLGAWAAEKLGKKGGDAEAYVREAALAAIDHADIGGKVLADFKRAKLNLTDKDIGAEMQLLLPVAREQVVGEK
ncbi:MAG: DUF1476 domain-containing protein [Pseudomonadota bacterium]|nr:DUF1476 domain-containing protein [Pseudomonadota bacterium]MDE3037247.1 DUF1476 domain-containing protein [Pseudomonadota bacterium]